MKNLRNLLILVGLAATILGFRASAQAADQPPALKGYDVVAYFTEKRAMLGIPQHQHEWDGAT